ncbi:synaptic vesicle glycoprotein 2B-like isoform X3 [Bacillus rossius redtenbacheri]|uniref:synaptic vesicle glycoprotein 2B-like isoform X3 n=1 Tax=Bacillus rossius redtenbacheri TaxID=93214 RepID=UPI002FDE700C
MPEQGTTDAKRKAGNECMDFEGAINQAVSTVCEIYGTAYLLPAAQCDFNMTAQQKGLLGSIALIGVICSSQLWGYLADSLGRKKIIVFTLAMDAVCGIASSLAPDFYSFLIVRFFGGFFICGAATVVYVYIGEFHAEANRAKFIILLSVVVSLSSIFQPGEKMYRPESQISPVGGIAWLVIPQDWEVDLPWLTFNSWRVFVVLCAVPGILACSFVLLLLPESPRYLLDQGEQQEALRVMKRIYSQNTNDNPVNYLVKVITMEDPFEDRAQKGNDKSLISVIKGFWYQALSLLKKPYLSSTIQICFLQFGQFICFNSLSLWGPEIFNRMGEFSSANPEKYVTVCEVFSVPGSLNGDDQVTILNGTVNQSGCVTSIDPMAFKNTLIIAATASVGGLLVGYIVNYVGKRNFTCILLFLATCCGLGLNFARTSTLVLILACGFITFSELSTNLVSTITIDVFPTHLRATAVCLSLMMGRIGGICGSLMIGGLVELNCGSVLYSFSGLLLLCCIVSWFLPVTDQKKKI